ncbi:MAG: PolA [uncultured Pyrinomonadaceae bacterium]|uniref:PolA n=1 Tax=uncultured Pyrinomonadaceae bacterium TaxID=2283094 RepID=A0A6J4PKN1_9BACT|nr:MAG: PolA [uncultured Pyrinomonadaceae bacterium]
MARRADEIETAYEKLFQAKVLGCDTETSSLSVRYGKLFSVQFSDGGFSVLIPVSEGVALGRLAAVLENPDITKIFHNAKFDLEFLRESGYQVSNVFDTMIAEKVLTKGANQSASLAETLYRYFAIDLDKSQRAKFNRNWNGVWTQDLVNYALSDVVYLPELKKQQELWLERLNLKSVYENQIAKIII